MPTTACFVATIPLLLGCAAAQADSAPAPAPRRPLFTMPAGEHDLADFVGMLAQIRKGTIDCAPAELDRVVDRTVVLQRELRLDGAAFEDVATTLLFYRGLIVVPGERPGPERAIALDDAQRLHDSAVTRTPAQVLARPSRLEFVSTVASGGDPGPVVRANALRPFFAMTRDPWALRVAPDADGVRLTGTTEQVVFALRLIDMVDGRPPTPPSEIAWTTGEKLAWPGGKQPLADFLQRFSAMLDANVIGDAGQADLDLGDAAEVAADAWYACATRALRAVDRVLVPVAAQHRVFLVRALRDRGGREVVWRAHFLPAAAVDASGAIMPVATLVVPQHVDIRTLMNALRPRLVAGSSLTVGTQGGKELLFCGLSDDLAAALAVVREIDVAGDRGGR